MLMTTHQICRE